MNRRYPNDILEQQIDKALNEITFFFEYDWLSLENGDHPLQLLWNRSDILSTLELYIFGEALRQMKLENESWLKGQIKSIKGKNSNNRRGAFFEIIGLSYFLNSSSKVIPAPNSQPGYDATILSNNQKTYISNKSFGRSKHDQEFEDEAQETEEKILMLMTKFRIHYAEYFITFENTTSPKKEDWERLRALLNKVIRDFSRANNRNEYRVSKEVKINNWHVKVRQTERVSNLNRGFISYQLMIFGPYHYNEERNLYDKLDSAHENFTRHVPATGATNIIYIRVPLTISVEQCKKWTESYFNSNPATTAHIVLFYQCSISYNPHEGSQSLIHTFLPVLNPHLNPILNNKFPPYSLSIPVGGVSQLTPNVKLVVDGKVKDEHELGPNYFYQGGRFYENAIEKNGAIEGVLRHLAPGIQEISVFTLEGKTVTLSGNFQTSDELLIL